MTFIVGVLVAVGLMSPAAVAAQSAPEPSVVVVSGEGIVKATPDQAWVGIAAETRSSSPRDAQARNAEAMALVQQKIAGLGIPKDAVRTVAIDLQVEYDYANGRQTPRGYIARNRIEVRVDDLARLGEVLDASVGSGATQLQGLRFDIKKRDALEREALQRAVADAMLRADAAAAGAHRVVDRVVRIEESNARQGRPLPMTAASRAMVSEAVTVTPVAAGEIEVHAQVTLTVTVK